MSIVEKIEEIYDSQNLSFNKSYLEDLIKDLMSVNKVFSDKLDLSNTEFYSYDASLNNLDKYLKINSLLYQMHRDEAIWNILKEIKEELELLNEHHQS